VFFLNEMGGMLYLMFPARPVNAVQPMDIYIQSATQIEPSMHIKLKPTYNIQNINQVTPANRIKFSMNFLQRRKGGVNCIFCLN